jgi:hypothetical protein
MKRSSPTDLLARLAGLGALVVLIAAGCNNPSAPAGVCKESRECAAGTGVCRNGVCTQVTCANMPTACMAGEMCNTTTNQCVPGEAMFKPCKVSTDCAPGTGVCRNMKCTVTPCADTAPCQGDELCVMSQCTPPAKATSGHSLAAGGSVSTSSKHIHIGLTGQGRAVGASSSSKHKQVTGATSLMRR